MTRQQGGLHEGNLDPYVGTADYIAAFAVEGKLLNVMNLWRAHDIVEVLHGSLCGLLRDPSSS